MARNNMRSWVEEASVCSSKPGIECEALRRFQRSIILHKMVILERERESLGVNHFSTVTLHNLRRFEGGECSGGAALLARSISCSFLVDITHSALCFAKDKP